jgi:hypothetical protein
MFKQTLPVLPSLSSLPSLGSTEDQGEALEGLPPIHIAPPENSQRAPRMVLTSHHILPSLFFNHTGLLRPLPKWQEVPTSGPLYLQFSLPGTLELDLITSVHVNLLNTISSYLVIPSEMILPTHLIPLYRLIALKALITN